MSAKLIKLAVATPLAVVGLLACAHMTMVKAAPKPGAEEFGYGPRTTVGGSYRVAIEETAPFRKGKLLSTTLSVRDAHDAAIDGAQITIDGGMPQHGHGLPTRPRVSKELGNGRYEIDGLKFNMGGWWELKFVIAGATSRDSVTFNLEL